MRIKLVNTDFVSLLYWRPCILLSLSVLPKIEFNSFWSLTNPIAIIYRFGLQQTPKPKRDWDELIWASSSSRSKRGKSLINKFYFSRCWTQFREWFVFFNKRKVLDLFSKQNGLFFCWFSFCRFTSYKDENKFSPEEASIIKGLKSLESQSKQKFQIQNQKKRVSLLPIHP